VLLQRTLLQVPLLKEAILDSVKIEFNYDTKGNHIGRDYLVQTQKSNNLPMYIKGKANLSQVAAH
jgi:hypothetical protein